MSIDSLINSSRSSDVIATDNDLLMDELNARELFCPKIVAIQHDMVTSNY